MAKPRPPPDPTCPLPAEATSYLDGKPDLAIQLYSTRIRVSEARAEDKLRAHLTDLGFRELPPIHIPRSN